MSSHMIGVTVDLDFDELLSEQSHFSQVGNLLTLETELKQSKCYH